MLSRLHGLFPFFRLLFPSWKFFDKVGSLPQLFYRIESADWQLALQQPQLHWSHFFLNPKGNLYHYHQSLVQRLLLDLMELTPDRLEQSQWYLLTTELVRHQILVQSPSAKGRQFQFKVTVKEPETVDALTSAWSEV